ncbi:MAG: bifunctional serine/threonine-protein kinase/ABC transporter substrate-binding protein [Cyanobacteria bacterium J06623_7]
MEAFSPGDKIQSRYRILNQLGSGGFSRTYLAEDINRFNERCVLKEFAPQMKKTSTLQKAQEMFEREAGALHRLEHPQIPKFHQILRYENADSECLFLVQDYIEGTTYHQLLNQRLKQGHKFDEREIEQLLIQVLPILEYVHSEGIIHRDISPENLMLSTKSKQPILIDFGCIKEVENKAQLELLSTDSKNSIPLVGTAIGKANYAPPEQVMKGIVYPHTDLYALAATAVVLLTGKMPQELRNSVNSRWDWQSFASINPKLKEILSKMLEPRPSDRFTSATEVRQVIQEYIQTDSYSNETSTSRSLSRRENSAEGNWSQYLNLKYLGIIVPIVFLLLLGRLMYPRIANQGISGNNSEISSQTKDKLAQRFSQGDKILISRLSTPEKETATRAFAAGNYQKAAALFSASLKRKANDPEALIYFNNALIGSGKSYRLAVPIPTGNNLNSALEVLRGVAQAQNQINQQGGIDNTPLKVEIINDENQPELAQKIARALIEDPEILGVVGHYTSEVTVAAAQIYEEGNLVVISPVSSAVELSNLNPYIFRTVSSDFIAARALAQYTIDEKQESQVAIFYNSQSEHSESLKLEFRSALTLSGGKVTNIFDLAEPNFSAVNAFQQALDSGAEALMFSTDPSRLDKALQVIQVNRKRLSLLGGDDIYTAKTLQIGGEAATGMVVEIPWHIKSNPESDFVQASNQLWGAEVSWRTAMAYDATQAIITAIANSPQVTRSNIQKTLADNNFSAPGASKTIQFSPSGDRISNIQLVEIRAGSNEFEYEFVPFTP